MNVKLVAITKPTIDGLNTAEEFIAYAARVSNPSNQMNTLTAPKLVKYLIEHNHWSPLEMVSATVEIETTRDIARQILRHRSFSFQEFSQRYADPNVLGYETRRCRLQDQKNRQNSIEISQETVGDELEYYQGLGDRWHQFQERVMEEATMAYEWAINNGIAKEQARAVLPEGLIHSRLYMSGTIRSWYHYCELRCQNGTQKEHIDIANKIKEIFSVEFPSVFGNIN